MVKPDNMNDTNNTPALWRSSDQKEFFLVGDAQGLAPGDFIIQNSVGHSLSVQRQDLVPFAIGAKEAVASLEERIRSYAE